MNKVRKGGSGMMGGGEEALNLHVPVRDVLVVSCSCIKYKHPLLGRADIDCTHCISNPLKACVDSPRIDFTM